MSHNSSSHRLVGRFFTSSTLPTFDETEQSLRKQWKLSVDDMTVQKQDDIFLFEFRQEKDKEEVVRNGPFNVNGALIVIKDPDSSDDDMIDFTFIQFRVTMKGFPTYLHNKVSLPKLQSLMGDNCPVLVTEDEDDGYVVYYFRKIDLKKPLNPGFYIAENQFVQFKYKNLGNFCYNCGMIGHAKKDCDQVEFPKKRALNATSTTHVYGPWLRVSPPAKFYREVLMKSENCGVGECEKKTLSYAQFFVEIEFNKVSVCKKVSVYNPRFSTVSTHKFRFPSSYLDATDSTTSTTSKAYEVIQREIYENTPFSRSRYRDKPRVIGKLVERLKWIQKNEFDCDDKWLSIKLKVNKIKLLGPVDYESILVGCGCGQLTESKISDLIKKRVEEKQDLLCLATWEDQIREVISEVGCTHYTHILDVSRRAKVARREAVQMEISSTRCPIPADRSSVSKLERYKVLGPDMDRLDPCMVCVGEMFLGEEAIILPCSHVFHSSCIEKWLQVGHKCPLCGFKLPSKK